MSDLISHSLHKATTAMQNREDEEVGNLKNKAMLTQASSATSSESDSYPGREQSKQCSSADSNKLHAYLKKRTLDEKRSGYPISSIKRNKLNELAVPDSSSSNKGEVLSADLLTPFCGEVRKRLLKRPHTATELLEKLKEKGCLKGPPMANRMRLENALLTLDAKVIEKPDRNHEYFLDQ